MRAVTLLLIAPACVLGFGFGFDLRPITGANRLAAVRPMGRALFMAADAAADVDVASPEAAAVEAETATKAAADTSAADKAAADKKAAAEAEADKAKAEAEAAAKAEAEAAAAAEAEAEAAAERAEAERESVKAEGKRELEAELQAARAPRPRVQVGDELPAIKVTTRYPTPAHPNPYPYPATRCIHHGTWLGAAWVRRWLGASHTGAAQAGAWRLYCIKLTPNIHI